MRDLAHLLEHPAGEIHDDLFEVSIIIPVRRYLHAFGPEPRNDLIQ